MFKNILKNKILKNFLVILCLMACFGMISIFLKQDGSYDLRNYHYYNGYEYVNDRLNFDVEPDGFHAYISPVIDVPTYLLISNFNPKIVAFIWGSLNGLIFFLLYLLCTEVIQAVTGTKVNKYFALLLALAGVIAPGFIGSIGTMMNDGLLSIFFIFALYLTIKNLNNNSGSFSAKVLFVAGLSMGLSMGLKLTMAIYGVGFLMGILFISQSKNILKNIFSVGLGLALGLVIMDGHWMYLLYQKFQNPLFPFYNNIFKSVYTSTQSIGDMRFLPTGFFDFVFFPITTFIDTHKVNEVPFTDVRFVMLYLGLILIAIKSIVSKKILGNLVTKYLILISVISYLAWEFEFGIYRYLIPMEVIAPLVIFTLVYSIARRRYQIITIMVCLIMMSFVRPMYWDRHEFTNTYFDVETSMDFAQYKNTTVYLNMSSAHELPISYIVPFFPKSTRFVSIDTKAIMPPIKYPGAKFYLTNTSGLADMENVKTELKNQRGLKIGEQVSGQLYSIFDDFRIFRVEEI